VDAENIRTLIEKFDNTTVLVIGDLMLDRYLKGTMSRISPEAPAPLVEITSERYQLGGAANAINTICNLGGKVLAVGVVGDDWFGKRLIGLLNQKNVDTSGLIEIKERPTTVKTRVIASQQYIIRLDREDREKISPEESTPLLEFINKNAEKIDVILISDYDKGVITNTLMKGIIETAKKFHKPVIVYPKIGNLLEYKGITLVITDLEKASSLTGIRQINETSIRNMGQWMLTHLECDYILITRGAEGMSLFTQDGSVFHVPAHAGKIHTITGNVDAIASVISLCLASGIPTMNDSVHLANLAAEIVLESPEGMILTREHLERKIGVN